MAMINLSSAVINEAIDCLNQAVSVLRTQCDTLAEVAGIVEDGWLGTDSGTLCDCIRQTKSRLGSAADGINGAAKTMNITLAEAWAAEKTVSLLEAQSAENQGTSGGGFR